MKKIVILLALFCAFAFSNTLSEIKQKGVIRIGVSKYMPPFSQLNDNGSFSGFEIDLAKRIAGDILGDGGKVEFIAVEQADRLDVVRQNKVDLLIAAYTRNDERAGLVEFSIPYFSISLATVSKKSANIKNIASMINKKVLVIPKSNSDIYVKKNLAATAVPCKDNGDCYRKLESGEGDVYMHNIVSVATIPIINSSYEIGINQIGEIFMDCVATQKNNHDLINAVNDVILNLSKGGFFKDNYNNTFEPFYRGSLDKKYFLLDDFYRMMF